MEKNIFEKMLINWPLSMNSKMNNKKAREVRDADAHYDIDGVSFSADGVVISGDNQTTKGAPPPEKKLKRPADHKVDRKTE